MLHSTFTFVLFLNGKDSLRPSLFQLQQSALEHTTDDPATEEPMLPNRRNYGDSQVPSWSNSRTHCTTPCQCNLQRCAARWSTVRDRASTEGPTTRFSAFSLLGGVWRMSRPPCVVVGSVRWIAHASHCEKKETSSCSASVSFVLCIVSRTSLLFRYRPSSLIMCSMLLRCSW